MEIGEQTVKLTFFSDIKLGGANEGANKGAIEEQLREQLREQQKELKIN